MVLKFKYDNNSVLKFNFGPESSFPQFLYVPEWKVDEELKNSNNAFLRDFN